MNALSTTGLHAAVSLLSKCVLVTYEAKAKSCLMFLVQSWHILSEILLMELVELAAEYNIREQKKKWYHIMFLFTGLLIS